MYSCNLERMKDKIQTFSQFGTTKNGGITRYSLSEAALIARQEFVRRMKAIGAVIRCKPLCHHSRHRKLQADQHGIPC